MSEPKNLKARYLRVNQRTVYRLRRGSKAARVQGGGNFVR